jgi:hypothetical protein
MTESMESAPQPPRGRPGKKSLLIALAAWAVLGLMWSLLQFGFSELLFRLAYHQILPGQENALYEASDLVAWPAGLLYQYRYDAWTKEALEVLVRNREQPDADRVEAATLLQSWKETGEKPGELDTFIGSHEVAVETNEAETYGIYIAVCLVWGAVLGMAGFAATALFLLAWRRPVV